MLSHISLLLRCKDSQLTQQVVKIRMHVSPCLDGASSYTLATTWGIALELGINTCLCSSSDLPSSLRNGALCCWMPDRTIKQ